MANLFWRLKQNWPLDRVFTFQLQAEPYEQRRFKARARSLLWNAITRGDVVKASCCQHPGCREEQVMGHHHKGYAPENALDVLWLCRKHHKEADPRGYNKRVKLGLEPQSPVEPKRKPRPPRLQSDDDLTALYYPLLFER